MCPFFIRPGASFVVDLYGFSFLKNVEDCVLISSLELEWGRYLNALHVESKIT